MNIDGGGARSVWHAAKPYLAGLGGVAAITLVMALLLRQLQVPNLSMVYLLLVLWLGSRYGRGPAVAASVLAFVAYDYFLVPPVGTLLVSGPRELLELFLLLAAALVTGQLAASLRRTQAVAESLAAEARALYELATTMLRLPDIDGALVLLAERAAALASVRVFGLVALEGDRPRVIAGGPLSDEVLRQATWSFRNRQAVGVRVREGELELVKTQPLREDGPALLPLTSGVVVVGFEAGPQLAADLRMLAALAGLGDLLLERRRALVESERARSLEASDRLKAAILSSISHDLKSPIASLRAGLTALMAPRSGVDPEQRELLHDLDHQALRLDRLVGDLLIMSRIEAGVPLDLEPRSLPEIVGEVLPPLAREMAPFNLQVDVPDHLPLVMADELQMGRVLGNLLINAIEWTPAGGRIQLGAEVRGDRLGVWVQNDGTEIDPQELDRVFERFWTKRTTGSGLGLAICKRIVEAHGGTIRAQNRRGGPRFTFTIPLAPVLVAR